MTTKNTKAATNTTTRKVEVFRAGTFTAMNGQSYAFSEADVQAIADNYNAETAPAPVVVGHPKHDDPAFGWADKFTVNKNGTLIASLKDLAPEFVTAVTDGRYRKISMKLFPPDASNNPTPGSYYPRHIGFLGGAAPAVSGLTPVQFSNDDGLIEINFTEPALEDVASIFRSMREFIIEKFSRDDADKAVPEYLIRWVDDASDPKSDATPAFTTPKQKEPFMSKDAEKLAAREAEVAKREADLCHTENLNFADTLIESGKLLPLQKAGVVALLDNLDGQDTADIAFTDDGTDKEINASQLLKDLLSAQPEIVKFGKSDLGDALNTSAVSFAAPDGMSVDADDLARHQKAVIFQNQNPGTDYLAV